MDITCGNTSANGRAICDLPEGHNGVCFFNRTNPKWQPQVSFQTKYNNLITALLAYAPHLNCQHVTSPAPYLACNCNACNLARALLAM
jgi:hypothetical protein